MFTSYCIGFHSVSQNYTVWCEHTFPSTITLGMNLKTLNIILIWLDEKKQPSEKRYKRKYSSSSNKNMSKELKIHFFMTDDEIQFLDSLANSNFMGSKCINSIKWIHKNYN